MGEFEMNHSRTRPRRQLLFGRENSGRDGDDARRSARCGERDTQRPQPCGGASARARQRGFPSRTWLRVVARARR